MLYARLTPVRALVVFTRAQSLRTLPDELLAAKEEKERRQERDRARSGRSRSGGAAAAKAKKDAPPPGGLGWTATAVEQLADVTYRAYAEDFFRDLSAADIGGLLPRNEGPDSEVFRIPPTGRGYLQRWAEEDAAEAVRLEQQRAAQAASSRRKRALAAMGRNAAPDASAMVTVISPHGEKEEEVCHVCCEGTSVDGNNIVYCEQCNVPVHQLCYGVKTLPEGPWLCTPCAEGNKGAQCALCTVPGGALKPVRPATGAGAQKKQYAHLFCSQWIPETYVQDTEAMSPIEGVLAISKARQGLVCGVCNMRGGACIQCACGQCVAAFHPTCARSAQLRMEIISKGANLDQLELKAYCARHTKLKGDAEEGTATAAAAAAAAAGKAAAAQAAAIANGGGAAATAAGGTDPAAAAASGSGAAVAGSPGGSGSGNGVAAAVTAAPPAMSMLDACEPMEVGRLLGMALPLHGVTAAEAAAQMGVGEAQLASWLKSPAGSAAITTSARAWLKAAQSRRLEARAQAVAVAVRDKGKQQAAKLIAAGEVANGHGNGRVTPVVQVTPPAPEPAERLHPMTAMLFDRQDALPPHIEVGDATAERLRAASRLSAPLLAAHAAARGAAPGGAGEPGAAAATADVGAVPHGGRCAVCVVQRKGRCGTNTAPEKCLRRPLVVQQPAVPAMGTLPAGAPVVTGSSGADAGVGWGAGWGASSEGFDALLPSNLPPSEAQLPPLETARATLASAACQELLAVAPEDEVTAELLVAQHELMLQMRANERIFGVVLERALADVDGQAAARAARMERNCAVEELTEAVKAAKAKQRKENRDRSLEERRRAARTASAEALEARPRERGRDTRKRERKDELSDEVQAAITRAGDCLQRVREAKRDCENLRVIVERVARREVLKKEIAVAAREIEAARPGGGQGAASSKKRARH